MNSKIITINGIDYTIYENGEIYGSRNKKISQRVNADGYMEVTLGSNELGRIRERVHRIVALAFIDNPNNFNEVNHKDYNRTNNNVDNLEWIDHKSNVKYSAEAGHYRQKQGEFNGRAKLNWTQVFQIRDIYNNGKTISEICKIYNKPYSTIFNIVHNKTWIEQ